MRARIRPATLDDATAIAGLIAMLGYPVDAAALRRLLASLASAPAVAILVADLEGETVGLLTLTARPSLTLQGWVGAIGELIVHPEYRGLAFGEALLQYAKGLAVECGLERLECPLPGGAEEAATFLLDRGFCTADEESFRWSGLEGRHPRLPTVPDGATRRAVSA